MDKQEFAQRAHDICLESFKAYFLENDFAKSMRYVENQGIRSFCVHSDNQPISYENFVTYVMPLKDLNAKAHILSLKEELTFLAESFCVILIQAKLEFFIDQCYKLLVPCRVSYFVTCKEEQLQIIHIHFALPHQTVRTSRLQAALEDNLPFDEQLSSKELLGPAVSVGLYSPNGLLYYRLGKEPRITFVNNTLLKMLDYPDSNDFFQQTAGSIPKLIAAEDVPLFTKKLARHTAGKIISFNLHLLKADGSPFPVLLRANYTPGKEPHYVLSSTPLELPPEELDCGQPLDDNTPEDYSIPFELYIQLALDTLVQYGRKNGLSYGNNNDPLLQLTASVVNASHAWVDDIRDLNSDTKLLASYTAPGAKEINHFPLASSEVLRLIRRFPVNSFNSLEEYPEPMRMICRRIGITSGIHEVIEYNGQPAFILHLFRQNDAAPWTEHEVNIAQQAARIYKIILKNYPPAKDTSTVKNIDQANAQGGSL